MIKVVVADAQYLTRKGLLALLNRSSFVSIKGEASNPIELEELTQDLDYDLVLLDHVSSEEFSNLNVIRPPAYLKKESIILVSDDQNERRVHQYLNNGIMGFLTKKCDQQEISNAMQQVSRGNRFYCSRILNMILEEKKNPIQNKLNMLSEREMEIIRLIATGNKTSEIANRLHLSVHTVNTHRKNILKKLELKSPVELVMLAVEQGLVEPSQG